MTRGSSLALSCVDRYAEWGSVKNDVDTKPSVSPHCIVLVHSLMIRYYYHHWGGEEGEMPQPKDNSGKNWEFMQSFCLKHRRFNCCPWIMQTLKNLLQCSAHLIGRRTTLRDLETILNVAIVTQKDLFSILRCERSIWIFLLHNNANSRFVNHKEVVSSLADNWAPINRCWRHERTRSVNVNEWKGHWRGPSSSLVFSSWQTERRRRRRYFLKRV